MYHVFYSDSWPHGEPKHHPLFYASFTNKADAEFYISGIDISSEHFKILKDDTKPPCLRLGVTYSWQLKK